MIWSKSVEFFDSFCDVTVFLSCLRGSGNFLSFFSSECEAYILGFIYKRGECILQCEQRLVIVSEACASMYTAVYGINAQLQPIMWSP